ncbi:MAG: O-antigen ligase family protein [Candidatus Kapabacteria bacterium]|nr:O-antigen ligase family protein [Candidatus Kapabacteria bacterium]
MIKSNHNIIANKRYFEFSKISNIFAIIATIIALLFCSILTYLNLSLFILPIVLLFPLCYIWIKYPKIWIYTIIASLTYFLTDSSEGVSALDVIVGGFYVFSLFVWFAWQLIIKRNRLVYNISDWLMLFLVALLPFFYLITFFNNINPLDGFREIILFILVLYYFPFRYYLKDKKDIIYLLVLFAIVIFIIDLQQFYNYFYNFKKSVVYAFQLSQSKGRVNQTLFTTGIVSSLLFTFYIKSTKFRILTILLSTLTILALLLTFSRTFWILVIFESLIIFLYINKTEKTKFLLYLSSTILLSYGILYFAFNDKLLVLNTFATKKLLSSTQGTKDVSVIARLLEYKVVLRNIQDHPLGGNGFSKIFAFHNGLAPEVVKTQFIHNGYFYISYRAGIPFAIVYVFIILYNTIYPIYLHRYLKDEFTKNIAFLVSISFISILISDFTTPQFFFREGYFIIAILIALNGFCKLQLDNEQKVKYAQHT